MKKLLFISLCFLVSCVNETKMKETNITDVVPEITVVSSFSVTSKNSELTSKTGINVSTNEMITKNVYEGDKILFKEFQFTLNNNIDGAFNFYSDNGKLICNVPAEVSVMSMPPDGSGVTNYTKGDNVELLGMSLIKINSVNFVISDIRFNN